MPCKDPERDIGAGTDLASDAGLRELLEQARVLGSTYAVSEPTRREQADGLSDRLRPEQLTGVWHRDQPGVTGDTKRLREVRGGSRALVIGQAEADHAVRRHPHRDPRE